MAKIWKKANQRIIDRERKLEIPFECFVHAEAGFFAKYGSSFVAKPYDNPPKGSTNVMKIDWAPPAPAPVAEPAPAPQEAPAEPAAPEEAPADPSQPEGGEEAPAEPEPSAPVAEKKAKGKGKK